MKLSQLGEFGLIDRIGKGLKTTSKKIIAGIGDDTAVINSFCPFGRKYLLVTTDAMIENVHFKVSGRFSFQDLGYKALFVNISDILSMGGTPTFAFVTLGLPKNLDVKKVDQLYSGMKKLAKKLNIEIIGGDTVSSPKEIVISITLLGEVSKRDLLLRSGAKEGDAIVVTGFFGEEAARQFRVPHSLPAGRHGALRIRLHESKIIAKSRKVTSMIDSSDGLVRSVLELCKASNAGARIWKELVPIAKGATLDQALYGGEEYELVFTVPKEKLSGFMKKVLKITKTKFSLVGEIMPKAFGVKLADNSGAVFDLKKKGYEHFKNPKS